MAYRGVRCIGRFVENIKIFGWSLQACSAILDRCMLLIVDCNF